MIFRVSSIGLFVRCERSEGDNIALDDREKDNSNHSLSHIFLKLTRIVLKLV
jgi:hypothetical protein